ncbi:hypothetical protein N7456_000360 [Penicillium angulare]|uniref:Subtelomeric hrmA-associated cluster protein AFUB-079030/YDR124W-like helical bundle domain-containing protein n=1 Tax=Penicillium angulare TaxID=116970 RepID=A0A9W9KQV0_9EURO|nr:hypothetical protein N7456_000360 [Penicillium angulare]
MDFNRPHLRAGESLERRHSDTSLPQSHMAVTPNNQIGNLDFPHPHFAVIYLDYNGKLQVEASPSIAGCGGAIFTPDVTDRFMEMAVPNPQQMQFHNPPPTPSPWGMHPSQAQAQTPTPSPHTWPRPGQSRPAPELIPCEWQSHQTRRKRRDMKRLGMSSSSGTGISRTRPKSSSPPPTPPPNRSAFKIGDSAAVRRYIEKAFEDFQQLNCRVIAKSWIKLVEPRKQVHFPYNGRKVIAGVSQRVDPELTKPGWWPDGVLHREPDHLLKRDRLRLLVHILCELRESNGVTAEKLREAGQDVRRQISPANRLQVLDEIYFVRQMEERYLDGEIDGNTVIQVIHTHLPEANFQDEAGELTPMHSAPVMKMDEEDDQDLGDSHGSLLDESEQLAFSSHHQGLPLSPATSESSGPHSPTTTGFGGHHIGMMPSMIPHESPIDSKPGSVHAPVSVPLPVPVPGVHMGGGGGHGGYYAPAFTGEKNTGYWGEMAVSHGMNQFGY